MEDLEGRVEKAKILRYYLEHCAIGESKGRNLLINNANSIIGANCLIRLHASSNRDNFIGDFLTTQVPANFQSLDHHSYLILALWEENMIKAEEYPRLVEINKYYNPGKIGSARYIQEFSACRRGRVYLSQKGVMQRDRSFNRFILEDNSTKANVNLLITESSEDLQRASEIAQSKGLTPIILERLDKLKSSN